MAGIAGRSPRRKPGTAGQPTATVRGRGLQLHTGPTGPGHDPGGRVPRLTKNFIFKIKFQNLNCV